MTSPTGGDPGGSLGPRLPLFMDPQNEFGRLTILQMTGIDGVNLPVDPYLIGKSIELVVGDSAIESASSEQTKRYTIRVRNPVHVEKLIKMTKLIDGTPISITPHPTLNISKCVISSYDTICYTEEELLASIMVIRKYVALLLNAVTTVPLNSTMRIVKNLPSAATAKETTAPQVERVQSTRKKAP